MSGHGNFEDLIIADGLSRHDSLRSVLSFSSIEHIPMAVSIHGSFEDLNVSVSRRGSVRSNLSFRSIEPVPMSHAVSNTSIFLRHDEELDSHLVFEPQQSDRQANLRWMSLPLYLSNQATRKAVVAFSDNWGTVEVIRAEISIGGIKYWLTGQRKANENVAIVPFQGVAMDREDFQVLTEPMQSSNGANYSWVSSSGGNRPENAFLAGKDYITEEFVYVARAESDGEWYCGRLVPSKCLALIPYAGREKIFGIYDVLCENREA